MLRFPFCIDFYANFRHCAQFSKRFFYTAKHFLKLTSKYSRQVKYPIKKIKDRFLRFVIEYG